MRQNLCRNEKAAIRGQIHHALLSSAYLSDNSSHFSTWQQRSQNWCLFELWGEHCFEPLIKPVGKWHDNLWGDTDPVSAGEDAYAGKKKKKWQIKRGWEGKGQEKEGGRPPETRMTPSFSQLTSDIMKYEFDGSLQRKLHKHRRSPTLPDTPPELTSHPHC